PHCVQLPTSSASYLPLPYACGTTSTPSNAVSMAAASATSSPTGTSAPYLPPSRISRGPLRQSVATTGTSQKSASISTEGSPSQREDSTKTPACAMYGYGLEIQPGRSTDPVNPRSA